MKMSTSTRSMCSEHQQVSQHCPVLTLSLVSNSVLSLALSQHFAQYSLFCVYTNSLMQEPILHLRTHTLYSLLFGAPRSTLYVLQRKGGVAPRPGPPPILFFPFRFLHFKRALFSLFQLTMAHSNISTVRQACFGALIGIYQLFAFSLPT